MPTLANIHGASLVPDLSGALNLALKGFGTPQSRAAEQAEAQRQQDLQEALAVLMGHPMGGAAGSGMPPGAATPGINPEAPGLPPGVQGIVPGLEGAQTFPASGQGSVTGAQSEQDAFERSMPTPRASGAPAGFSRRQEAALLRVASLDPKMAAEMRQVLARGDEREKAAILAETEKGTRIASHIARQPDFRAKRAALGEAAQAAARRGEPVDRYVELMNLSEPQLDLALQRMLVMGTDLETLTKPVERFEAVTDEAGNIIGQRSSTTGKIVDDPRAVRTGAQFDQEIELARARGEAAAAPATAMARLLSEERLETERLKQEEARGRIEERREKLERGRTAVRARKKAARAKATLVSETVDKAISIVNENPYLTTGVGGQFLSGIGGTDARTLKATLDTIKANLGFAELQAMREASPTGGALGQISERELRFLQSTIASLDQEQDAAALRENLKTIKLSFNRWADAVQQAKAPSSADEVPDLPEPNVIQFGDLPE